MTLCFVAIAIFFVTANPNRIFSWFYLFGTIITFLGNLTFAYANTQLGSDSNDMIAFVNVGHGFYFVGGILAVVGLFGIAWAYRQMSQHFNPIGNQAKE